ncbi:restriction endonuclease subunit S [Bacillus sp. MYb56]|uniref:restriction endonuclease subunit S n=1 Tax=Bacillus sp. MYb56 TaxID=1827287 RepID=UPI000CFCD545|nr:restriction endonuclease subunit S [Bacillus sp. MYb56]PRD10421.1 restriction endonuclease subunit S [Bacillus sp. MYb56]
MVFKELKDISPIDWIGEIPNEWSLKKLKYLVCTVKGYAFKSELFEDNGVPIIKTTDIKNGEVKECNTFINEELVSDYENVRLKENDILMSTVGSKPEVVNSAVGQIGRVQKKYEGALLNQNAVILRCKSEDVYNDYLYYFLISNPYRKYLDLHAHGTANQASLSLKDILDFSMPLPPINTQISISNFLDDRLRNLNSLIHYKQKLIALLQEQHQSIITEVVTKGLNPNVKMKDSGVEWIGDIPEHWEVRKLKNMAFVQASNVDKKLHENEEEILLCNYVDVYYNDVINKKIEFMKATAKKEQIEKFTLKENDVIITKDSESPFDIAVPAWVEKDLPGVLCGYHLSHIRPNQEKLIGKYLLYCLKSDFIRQQFYSSANGVTRYGLSKDSIRNALFPMPPTNEQIDIANYLHRQNEVTIQSVYFIKEQVRKMNEYKQSLIAEVVTGKLDVYDYANVEKV